MTNTLVLLRGLTRGRYHWGGFSEQLKIAFPDIQLVFIDLAGNGLRANEKSPITIQAAVQDVRNQLKLHKINNPVNVLALSLGGMITLQWLNDYPQEICKAIVINSSHAKLSRINERMRPLTIVKLIIGSILPLAFREKIIYSVTSNKLRNNLILDEWILEAKQHPVSHINFIRQIRIARSFTTKLHINSDQLMLLASHTDHLVSMVSSQKLAIHTQSSLKLNETAGHEITLDDPDWVIEQAASVFGY